MLLFCYHHHKEKQKRTKQPVLGSMNGPPWAPYRSSLSSSSMWIPMHQRDVGCPYLRPDSVDPWGEALRLPPHHNQHRPPPRRHSYHADSSAPNKTYHGNIDYVVPYDPYSFRRWPRLVPDYNTYPRSKSPHSPMYVNTDMSEKHPPSSNASHHLHRTDSNCVLTDEAMYREEFAFSDRFYTGATAL